MDADGEDVQYIDIPLWGRTEEEDTIQNASTLEPYDDAAIIKTFNSALRFYQSKASEQKAKTGSQTSLLGWRNQPLTLPDNSSECTEGAGNIPTRSAEAVDIPENHANESSFISKAFVEGQTEKISSSAKETSLELEQQHLTEQQLKLQNQYTKLYEQMQSVQRKQMELRSRMLKEDLNVPRWEENNNAVYDQNWGENAGGTQTPFPGHSEKVQFENYPSNQEDSKLGINNSYQSQMRPPWERSKSSANVDSETESTGHDQELADLLHAWYYVGYQTGKYQAKLKQRRDGT